MGAPQGYSPGIRRPMPVPMAKAIRCMLLATLLIALPLPAAEAAPRAKASIYGGVNAAIADFPFQAALVTKDRSPWEGQFCGAAILDATHVATAAHCVFDDASGRAVPPQSLDVLVGTARLRVSSTTPPAATEHRVAVTAVAFPPEYNPVTYDQDAAVLTLAEALTVSPAVAPIPLFSGAPLAALSPVTVTGWGAMSDGSFPADLQEVEVDVVDDAAVNCGQRYEGYVPARMLCARRAPDKDSCQGDSGGPLASMAAAGTRPTGWRLAGLVSFGEGCGKPEAAGVYSEVRDGAGPDNRIAEFLSRRPSGDAPRPAGLTELLGTPQPGQVLTCSSPWSNADSVVFQVQTHAGEALEPATSDASYAVAEADVGRSLRCVSRATGPSGRGLANSATVTVTAAPQQRNEPHPPVEPQPVPPTTPALPTPSTGDPAAEAQDTVRPTSRVVRSRCTKTVCSIQVQVTDPPPTSGVRTLSASATLRYSGRCRRDGRTRPCTRTRKLSASRSHLGAGRFLVRVRSRTAGTITLRFLSYDMAGNRQARATTRKLRIGRTAKRR